MRLDHEEFSCNPLVPATTVSYATPPNGQDLVENEGHGLAHVVATPKGQLISECLFDFLNFPKNHRNF